MIHQKGDVEDEGEPVAAEEEHECDTKVDDVLGENQLSTKVCQLCQRSRG